MHPLVMPTSGEKREAVDLVLNSSTFARSDQLRNFLRYVSEMELAGKGSEINEYLIGVEALGRAPGYSTADDSTVRARAHALRLKLHEYYDKENPETPWRIELPKGAYNLRFVEHFPQPVANNAARDGSPSVARSWRRPLAAFLLGCLLTAAAFLLLSKKWKADSTLTDAWGPLARPDSNAIICLATPGHLVLQPYANGVTLPDDLSLPAPPGVLDWYRQHRTLSPGDHLVMHTTNNAIPLGEALGAATVAQALNGFGASYQVLSERAVSSSALRGRNNIVLGNPDYSAVAEKLLVRGKVSIEYDPNTRERIVRSRVPGGAVFLPSRDQYGAQTESFGVITVLPSEGANEGRRRTLLFSGTTSAGMQAAVEFFASSSHLRELRKKFPAGYPSAYQVIVRCRTDNVLPLGFRYETFFVLDNAP